MDNITTTDLSEFGYREIDMAQELLVAWVEQGLPEYFYNDGVMVMMNKFSGNVFLTNSDFQVAMMNNDRLELFYSCPECGFEGFKEEFDECDNDCCQQYIKEVCDE